MVAVAKVKVVANRSSSVGLADWPELRDGPGHVLEDGTRYWQQPVARTVFANAPDGRSLENAALSAVDADGEVIDTATPDHTRPPRRSTNPEP